MNIDQWLIKFYEAYELMGVSLTISKRNFLISILDDNKILTADEEKLMNEAIEILTRYFFKLSIKGQTFGDENRIKENFGKTIEENYKISSGYFLSLAKTFWTFHFEIHDLFPTYHNIILTQILRTVEGNISTVFFPMPETITLVTPEQRTSAQIEMLCKYASDVDIEKFIRENPLLEIDKKRQKIIEMKNKGNDTISKFPSNTSGQGKLASVPKEIQKWNWGAFFLTFIWGIGNGVWRSFLIFIPIINIAVPFILGAKGNTWAWQNRIWRDVNHFKKVQKTWAIVGLIVWVFAIFLKIIDTIIEE
jgi:hypothetical protein